MTKEAFTVENELFENSNFIMYTTDDGQVEIEVRLEYENVWLTQNAMSELFDTTRNNITMHIKNIFEENELYDKYMKTHLTQAEKDYLEIMGEEKPAEMSGKSLIIK